MIDLLATTKLAAKYTELSFYLVFASVSTLHFFKMVPIGVFGASRKQKFKTLQIKDIRDAGDVLIIEIRKKKELSRTFQVIF